MSIKDCLFEVKEAVQDFLYEKDANELLLNIKNRIDLKRGAKKIEALEKEIVQEVLDDVIKTNKIEKLNKLKDKEKVLKVFDYIVDVWDDNPMQGIKAYLVGTQSFKRGSRDSVDGAIVDYQNRYVNGLFNALDKQNLLDFAKQKSLHKEIIQEVMDNPFLNTEKRVPGVEYKDQPMFGNQESYKIAKIIKEWNEIVVKDKNDLGAWISMLPGYVFRQSHLTEKMLKAAGESIVDEAAHKAAWIEFILPRLDHFRTFEGADPTKFLSNVFDNIMAGQHIRTLEAGQHFGSKNIAKRQSAERVLHFKDGKSFYEYDQKFGEGDLMQSIHFGLRKAGQDNGLMSKLGTNPENNLRTVIDLLKKRYKGTKASELTFTEIEKEFFNLNGVANHIDAGRTFWGMKSSTLAKIGGGLRTLSTTGKLVGLPITSIADIGYMMSEAGFNKIDQVTFLNTLFKELKRTKTPQELKDLLEPLGIFADSFGNHFSEHFVLREDATGSFNTYQSNFFRYIGFNSLMRKYKSSMALALQNHYGKLTKKSWNELDEQYKNILNQYNINASKWEMLRKTTLSDFEGNKYLTIENIDEISDLDILNYLKETNPQIKKFSAKKIKDTKKEIQSNWRVMIHDRVHHGIIEPARREKAIMNRGFKKGTVEGELLAMLWQFKSFGLSVYTKPIERSLKAVAPGTTVGSKMLALTSLGIVTTFWGYVALTISDLLAGKEPRDPKDYRTLSAAFLKGGGGGVLIDLFNAELTRSNGGALSTIAGPVYSDISGLFNATTKLLNGEPDKAALKAFRVLESNLPVDAWFIKPAYQFLLGYQIKEMLDPGYFNRLQRYTKQATGQEFFLKP